MSRNVITLAESGPPLLVAMPPEAAAVVTSSRIVSVEPWGDGRYKLTPGLRVGVVRVGREQEPLEVRVQPKVGIGRLLFLLGYAVDVGWRDEDVRVDEAPDLLTAVVDLLAGAAQRALAAGVLQGYRVVDDILPVVRGRLLAGPQITRRFAMPLPLEVRYQAYDADIAENRILRAACRLSLSVPRLSERTRRSLQHVLAQLAAVTDLSRGAPLPSWRHSRLNGRYAPALRLAALVWQHLSVERPEGQGGDPAPAAFVVTMWKVFEDFVTVALAEALAETPGATASQHPVDLDWAGLVPMQPDLVHFVADRPAFVVDAKYKAERADGFPHADAYQMLAYCTALRVRRGYLIYAKGNEDTAAYQIRNSDVVIGVHPLDLEGNPDQLLSTVRRLAQDLRLAS